MAYQNDPSQGSGLLGRVFTALGQGAPDIRRGTLIQDAELPYRNLFSDYTKSLAPQAAGLADFTSQYKALTPQLAALDQSHASQYGDLLKKASSYDPTANFQSSGNFLFGKLGDFGKQISDYNRNSQSLALANAGYGDRAPSTYQNILNASRISGNLLPAFQSIVGSLPTLSAQQNTDYFRNLSQIPGWMQGQTDALQATPFRALVPSQIGQSQIAGNLGLLNNLTQGEMGNSYFYNQPNGWAKLGNVFSGLYGGLQDAMDTASKAASTYSNIATSGLGGQMGLGGSTQPQSGGLAGGGSGMNISQILGLLSQLQGQNAQPNLGGGSSLNTGQYPGESLANMGVTMINPTPQATGAYSQFGIPGYNPNPYYSQNPYSQYGGYFQ